MRQNSYRFRVIWSWKFSTLVEKSYFCSWPRRMCYQKLLWYDWGPSQRLQLGWNKRNFFELKLLWVTTIYSSVLAYFIVNWPWRQCFSSSEGLIIGSNCVMVTMTQIPPRIDPLSAMLGRRRAAQKSCFKSAESHAASSPWVGCHRYASILCATKLFWV